MKVKNKRITLKDVLKRELKDPEFSFYFEREKSISEIARLVRDARLKARLTQANLPRRPKAVRLLLQGWSLAPISECLLLICLNGLPAHLKLSCWSDLSIRKLLRPERPVPLPVSLKEAERRSRWIESLSRIPPNVFPLLQPYCLLKLKLASYSTAPDEETASLLAPLVEFQPASSFFSVQGHSALDSGFSFAAIFST